MWVSLTVRMFHLKISHNKNIIKLKTLKKNIEPASSKIYCFFMKRDTKALDEVQNT